MISPLAALAAVLLSTLMVVADTPEVLDVKTTRSGMGWRIDVTLSHPDTGWDHYANGWEVLDAEGNHIATRELIHPHVKEQPFTRSLSNVMVPDGVRVIYIRARCSLQKDFVGPTIEVPLLDNTVRNDY
ncbi:MAG: hypothetical protein CSA70_02550 [Rhodobacterales bacterium]|nr:MAG: hypothetical protein CSA70_02550 [Rhodobacterales bacterium]